MLKKKIFGMIYPKNSLHRSRLNPRDSARLMVLSQQDDSIQHKIFHDLPEF